MKARMALPAAEDFHPEHVEQHVVPPTPVVRIPQILGPALRTSRAIFVVFEFLVFQIFVFCFLLRVWFYGFVKFAFWVVRWGLPWLGGWGLFRLFAQILRIVGRIRHSWYHNRS
jgi:hypothetical protein